MEKDAPKLTLEITEFDLKSRGRSGNGPLLMDGGSTYHHQAGVGNQDMVYDSSGGNGATGVGGGSIYDPHRGMMVPRSGFAPGVPRGAIHPNMNTR